MIRTQVSLSAGMYRAAKRTARQLGISFAELVRRALGQVLSERNLLEEPWMRHAGSVESGDPEASRTVDEGRPGHYDLYDPSGDTGPARELSVADAKARLSACLRSAEGGASIVVTRHGRPVAAIVPAEEVERLRRLRAAGPEGGLASVAGGWKGSAELASAIERLRRTVARAPRRPR